MVDRPSVALVHVHLVAHDGSRASFTERAARNADLDSVSAALGANGTAAVAWAVSVSEISKGPESLPAVWVRVQRPGRAFGPRVEIPAPYPVTDVALDVGPDGRLEIVFAGWSSSANQRVIFHTEQGPDGQFSPPVGIASTRSGSQFFLAVIAGGPGRGRVIYDDDAPYGQPGEDVAFLRTAQDVWTGPQRFELGSNTDTAVTALPDGGAAITYMLRHVAMVRRAPPGGEFGAAEAVEHVPRCLYASQPTLAANKRGDLLLARTETFIPPDDRCGRFSFGRVVAAFAAHNQPFAPAQVLSPLGTVPVDGIPAAALTDSGRRLVAWSTEATDATFPDTLVAATGAATADRPPPPKDRTPPTLSVSVSRQALRRAAVDSTLHATITCSERCAAQVGLSPYFWLDEPPPNLLNSLRAVVVARRGPQPVTWHLSAVQRHDVRAVLSDMKEVGLVVDATATDQAGNFRHTHTTLAKDTLRLP